MHAKPSSKFVALIDVYGTPAAAASVWEIHPKVLYRFLKGKGGLTLDTAIQIAHRTGISMDDLYVRHEDQA